MSFFLRQSGAVNDPGRDSWTERSSIHWRRCACWPNVGVPTATPSGHTLRSDITPGPSEAWLTKSMDMEKWKTVTRFPLLHTPDGGYLNLEAATLH